MEIRWLGGPSVLLASKDATLVVDAAGIDFVNVGKVDIALHCRGLGTELAPLNQRPFIIDGPGEYEVRGAFIVGVQLEGCDGGSADAPELSCQLFSVEVDDIRFCHLGGLRQRLGQSQIEVLGQVDVLAIELGGPDGLTPALAAELVGQLEPGWVIPIGEASLPGAESNALSKFMEELAAEAGNDRSSLSVDSSRLPLETTLARLIPTA